MSSTPFPVVSPDAARGRLLQTGLAEGKLKAALESHSTAERRRRERINSRLTTLRSLMPNTDKVGLSPNIKKIVRF
ncbi:hypothetical protein AAC387_Pa08g1209 [Persea americana]